MFLYALSLLVIASVLLGACAQATPTAAPAVVTEAPPPTEVPPSPTPAPVSIIIGTTDKLASLDPADAYAIYDWENITNISQGLLSYVPGTTDVQPDLATAMPDISADGLTYTFTLKDGVKFADGTDLTAAMYVAQLNRLLTIGPKCPNDVADTLAIPYVDSITNPSGNTIVFKLKTPVGFFVQILARAPYVASDPKSFPADKCNLIPEAPVYGTGPWYITQLNPDEQIVLEPNPYYTGDLKPQVDQIIVRHYSDPQTMALAVQNGEIDIAWRFLGPDLIGQLQGVSGLTVSAVDGGSIRYFVVNHTMAPMDDPNVRKAIAYAIDRNEIADTVFGGQVAPLYSQIPPGFVGADEAFDTMYAAPNLDAARAALAKSGYTQAKPLKLEMWYPPEHYGAETASWMQVIKKQLEATNAIQVTLQAQEWSTYVSALTGGKSYPIGVLGWFFDYPDSSNYIDPWVFNKGMGTNITAPQEGSSTGVPIDDQAKQLVDLLVQADSEADQAKRADLYKQAQEIYAGMVVTVPLFFNAEHVVYRSNIHGSNKYAVPETLNIGPTIDFNYATLSKSQ
jgi:peptide/nickel transport system substrate-binding protein